MKEMEYAFLLILVPFAISGVIAAIISATVNYLFLRKNIKHQEDILKITEENKFKLVEIEKEFDKKFLLYTEKNKFKLAAIDKRLQVAQEAFNLWEEMRKVVHSDFHIKIKIVNECTEWWHQNCLYLSPKVRKEFFKIIRRIDFYEVNKQVAQDTHDFNDLNRIFSEINDLGEIIEESVDLEPISNGKDITS